MLDHLLARNEFAGLGLGSEMQLFGRRQQRLGANLVEIVLGGIGGEFGGQHLLEFIHPFGGRHLLGFAGRFAVDHCRFIDLINGIVHILFARVLVWQVIAAIACHTLAWW
ncbi:hypothetical protein J2S30_001695 [Herbaspirillum rubrisubalbicans]|nr:hypothetical protein [Herbaspirillum rubrisubalbicans]